MKYITILFAMILMIGLVGAVTELPPVKKGECVNLPQTCITCTYNNITSIYVQGNTSLLLDGEYAMTKNGYNYNYTFCDTNQYGTYIVEGHGDVDGTNTAWGGYTFEVNGSGSTVTSEQISLFIITLIILALVAAFWFITSLMFKHPGTKIFLMAMCIGTVILILGVMVSNASLYLAEFPNLASIYEKYYILILSLSGAGLLGIIVWFIYYSVILFNKSRGRTPDED